MTIEAALYRRLSFFDGLTDIVAGRIFPLEAPQDIKKPFIVYQRVGTRAVDHLNGSSNVAQVRFQVDCYATRYEDVLAIADQMRLALEGWRDMEEEPAVQGTLYLNRIDGLETETDPKLRRVILEFQITSNEQPIE